jgi:hypothetical protein
MRKQTKHSARGLGTCSHGAVSPCCPRSNTVRAPRHSEAATTKAYAIRGLFVLLTLALVLWANPFALGQRKQRGFSQRTLAFPGSLPGQQQPKNQQVQTAPDSVKNRHQAPVGTEARSPGPAPSIRAVPSGIDCDNAPGIVIHDDGTVENGYVSGPGITGIFADKFTPAVYPSIYTSVCLAFNTLCVGPTSYPIEVVVFDDDGPGGSPGTELGAMPVTITNIPTFPDPAPAWNSFDISSLNIVVNDGSVYIGARWTPQNLTDEVYMSSDENGPGFGGGYYFDNISNVWTPIQNFFPAYRAMFIRAVEQLGGLAVVNTVPAVGSVVFTQPTDFVVNVREPVQPDTLQASDFTVNGTAANSVDYTPGTTTMTFHFTSTPVTGQGAQTMHIAQGAFLSDPGGDPVHEFNGTFRYAVLLLQEDSTVPSVGGAFSPPAPGTYQFDVNWNEAVDPTSVQTSDLTLSSNPGATVTGVSVINGNTTRFTLSIETGGSLTASIAAGAITDQFGNPNDAFSGNYTVEGCPPGQYVITGGTDRIVPGDTNIGSNCDECDTFIPLPFNFQLYGATYTGVNVSSNGRLDFVNANEPGGFITACLPSPPSYFTGLPYDNTIFPLWQDQLTSATSPGCASFPGGTCGVFTSVTGSAPNRILNIEWRTVLHDDDTAPQNFEVRLYENDPNERFDVVIGTLTPPIFAERAWVSGVQGDGALGFYTEDFCKCPPALPPQNESRAYTLTPCATPTPTPTPTATPTATPRPTFTPRVRPTPHPRPRR